MRAALLACAMVVSACGTPARLSTRMTVQPLLFGPVHSLGGKLRRPMGERVTGMHLRAKHQSSAVGGTDGSSQGSRSRTALGEADFSVLLITEGDHKRWLVVHELGCSGMGAFLIFGAISKAECHARGAQYQPPPTPRRRRRAVRDKTSPRNTKRGEQHGSSDAVIDAPTRSPFDPTK